MDDEDLVRSVAAKMLEFLGYEVATAKEGGEAIDLFKSRRSAGAPFDAVILDLIIPNGIGGAQTMAELLRIDPDVKGIISSGYGESGPEGVALSGHAAIIGKPYELKKLRETLERVLQTSRA